MNSKERLALALNHQEPDRIPFDLGGTGLTTLHFTAYRNLRRHLGLPPVQARVAAMAEQLAMVDEDVTERLRADVWPVKPEAATAFQFIFRDEGAYEAYLDEWGIGWRKPKDGGLYYDMYRHPLAGAESAAEMQAARFPDPLDDGRFATLRAQAEAAAAAGKAVALWGPCAGVLEVYSWMRGYEPFYADLAVHQDLVATMLDRMVEFKCAFWERALREIGDLVDVVVEADDMAGQERLLFSPATYRRLVKPRHKRLFEFIKAQAPVKLFFHSCGAIRPLIPDLIEVGIDILNPVQVAAAGKAVALWGPCAGVLEVYSWMRGYEPFYVDLAVHQDLIATMLDRMVEFKCAFWERALGEIGDLVDVVVEADDMAGQEQLLFSPATYRRLVKPRHKRLFKFIKAQAPVKLFFHSCGAIRPLIPDLIEVGVDILNPVQVAAAGMDPAALKRDFGRDLVFWGGGVDTQQVLGTGTPAQVRDDVRRNIEALAPGGGFVFAAVHDIQANVPAENIMAMWDAWHEYGIY